MPYVKKRTRNRVKDSDANLESNTQYASFRKKKAKRFDSPVRILCTHYRTRDFDIDNGSIKAVLDQIVRAGILTDDSSKQIQEITHRFVKSREEKTIIKIQEI